MGLAVRTRKLADATAKRLAEAGIECGPLATGPGVRVGAMHAMQGLEFRCAAVVRVKSGLVAHEAPG